MPRSPLSRDAALAAHGDARAVGFHHGCEARHNRQIPLIAAKGDARNGSAPMESPS
jgi:hypothetical protein